MKFSVPRLLLFLVVTFLAACDSSVSVDGSLPAVNTSATRLPPPLPSDDAILAMVYDNAYSVPTGFFADERISTPRSYSLYHVKDSSLSYEVCSDDFAEAEAWEEADNESRSVSGVFVDSYENERYFEFIRELSFEQDVSNNNDLTSPGFARVFKCKHTDRNGVDRTLLDGYAGTLNSRPLTAATVRSFTEYLWQFTFFPASRKKVLDSYAGQSNQALQHTLLLAFSTKQGSGRCDLIEVSRWQFSADLDSGEFTKRFETIRLFEARFEDGAATICD